MAEATASGHRPSENANSTTTAVDKVVDFTSAQSIDQKHTAIMTPRSSTLLGYVVGLLLFSSQSLMAQVRSWTRMRKLRLQQVHTCVLSS